MPVADLISAIASLLWPLLVIVVLLVFGPQVLSKLKSSDDVTLEIGGQKLSFKQATDQQSDMISDLQREVAVLKQQLDALRTRQDVVPPEFTDSDDDAAVPDLRPGPGAGSTPPVPGGLERWTSVLPGRVPRSILWVDDHPENNAMLAESWRRDGAPVDVARSTGEAMRLLENRGYGLVISDLGRRESGVDVPDAGLRLLAQVRAAAPTTPFVLYGAANNSSFAEAADAAGASLVTDSTFDLVDYVNRLGLLDEG